MFLAEPTTTEPPDTLNYCADLTPHELYQIEDDMRTWVKFQRIDKAALRKEAQREFDKVWIMAVMGLTVGLLLLGIMLKMVGK